MKHYFNIQYQTIFKNSTNTEVAITVGDEDIAFTVTVVSATAILCPSINHKSKRTLVDTPKCGQLQAPSFYSSSEHGTGPLFLSTEKG